MVHHNDALESRLYRSYWDDGLLDIFAGAGIVGIGLCWMADLIAMGPVVPVVLAPFWGPLRRSLVEPRAGLVEFSDARSDRNRRLGRWSVWLGLAMLALFTALYFRAGPDPGTFLPLVIAGVPAFLLALLAAMAGLGLGLPRFLGYGAVLCVCGAGVAVAGAEPEVAMVTGGVLIALAGALLLSRFLRMDVESGEES